MTELMTHHTSKIITFSLLFLSSLSSAQAAEKLYGLAMHGSPKYNAESQSLSYVNIQAPKGGTLKTAASKNTYDTLNPYSLKGTAAEGLNLIYDRLMARTWDEPFTMYPLIAESVELAEDRSWIIFHLNPLARFNDNSPITADDVLFSFETLKEQGRPNMRRIYKLVSSAEKRSETSIKFTLGDGYDQETVMILSLMPVLSKSWWEGKDFEATLLEAPNSSGPYQISDIDPGRSITYKRNENYWAKDLLANKGQYNFETITYEYFRDDTVALEAFNKGDLNYRYEFSTNKWMSAYADSSNIVKYEAPHQRPERAKGFIFNMRRAPFDDINIRKAIALAFDEEWIKRNIYHDKGARSMSLFPNSPLAATSNGSTAEEELSIRQRLKKAANLLDQSGWLVENGQRIKDGKALSFELLISTAEEEKIALNLKKHLERLGISMNIRPMDSASFQKRRQDYDYDMIAHYWQNSLSPGTEQMLYWTCEAANTKGQFNYAGICEPEIDTLAASIAAAPDYETLSDNVHKLDAKLQDLNIMIPLFFKGVDYIAHDKNLYHPEKSPIYGSIVETWWMDSPTQ